MRRYGFARAASTSVSGAVFGTLMFLLGTVIGVVDPDSIGPGEEPYRLGAIVGGVGFLCGASFALLLAWAERRKPIAKLSVARAAIWGALGAAAFPALGGMPHVANILMFVCPLGAALASATVGTLCSCYSERSACGA